MRGASLHVARVSSLPITPRALLTDDGVRIEAVHRPSRSTPTIAPDLGRDLGRDLGIADNRGLAIVVAHGFGGSWRRPGVGRITEWLRSHGGVVAFDFRGHGRSGGLSTVGDREVLDLDAAVRWSRLLGYRKVATVGWSMGAAVLPRHQAGPARSLGVRAAAGAAPIAPPLRRSGGSPWVEQILPGELASSPSPAG
jgi:pimeloyl-ACP methyl ester carboxylesterase